MQTEMLGKAIWRHKIQENPSAAGDPPGTPLGELTALLQTPYLVGGADCPSPRTPSPDFGPSGLAFSTPPTPKLVPTLLPCCIKKRTTIMFFIIILLFTCIFFYCDMDPRGLMQINWLIELIHLRHLGNNGRISYFPLFRNELQNKLK